MYLNSLSYAIQKDVVSTDINDMNKCDGNILKYSNFILFVFEHLLDVRYVAATTVHDFKTSFPLQYNFFLISQVLF